MRLLKIEIIIIISQDNHTAASVREPCRRSKLMKTESGEQQAITGVDREGDGS